MPTTEWNNVTVAKLRRDMGVTQRQLADALGVQVQAVSYWETGRKLPREMSAELLTAIRRAIDRGSPGPWYQISDETRGEYLMRIFICAYGEAGLMQALLLNHRKHRPKRGPRPPS